jgi:hypothetical protein
VRSGIGNTAADPIFVSDVSVGGAPVSASNPLPTQSTVLPAGTDRSGTAGTASAQLAAANTSRRGLNIQNISANTLGINEFGGAAAIGTPGTYSLAAGATVNVRTNRQINVIASAAGSAYTATEF